MLESAAYGVPSELSESDVMVAVVLKPGETRRARRRCSTSARARWRTSRFPATSASWTALPKNHAERIQKFELREQAVTPDTWDREAHGYKVQR